MRQRSQERGTDFFVLLKRRRLDGSANQQGPIGGDGGLLQNGVEPAFLFGGERFVAIARFDATHADDAARHDERPELQRDCRQRSRSAAGGFGFFKGPRRRA